jgi:hypothetical protein
MEEISSENNHLNFQLDITQKSLETQATRFQLFQNETEISLNFQSEQLMTLKKEKVKKKFN